MFPGSSTNTLQNAVPSNMKNTVLCSLDCKTDEVHIIKIVMTHQWQCKGFGFACKRCHTTSQYSLLPHAFCATCTSRRSRRNYYLGVHRGIHVVVNCKNKATSSEPNLQQTWRTCFDLIQLSKYVVKLSTRNCIS